MGLLSTIARAFGASTRTPGVLSPYSDAHLTTIVWSDVLGTAAKILTREEALTLSAVSKARGILVGQIARWPLVQLTEPDSPDPAAAGQVVSAKPDDVQPEWLQRTEGAVSPWHRMMLTVDDLIFQGWALWYLNRDGDGPEGIIDAERVAPSAWRFDAFGQVVLDEVNTKGEVVQRVPGDDEVVLIPGPQEGLLSIANRTISGGLSIDRAWVGRVKSPVPVMDLSREDDEMTAPEVQTMVAEFAKARNDENGAITSTPAGVTLKEFGSDSDAQLYVEGRNAVRLDIASFVNIPGSIMDASQATATLTYVTQEGKRSEFADTTLPYWMDPIAARLSQDDVCPPGARVRFDTSTAYAVEASPYGPTQED
jgi:hypothetical protein